MLSFRNRLLILLTGLVVGAQTVTFVTALARTNSTERQRADAQLVAGAQIARRVIDYRERQLANAVSVLAADFGLREAVASADTPTVASALGNHAARIGADLTVAFDLDGNVIATGEGTRAIDPRFVKELLARGDHAPGRAAVPGHRRADPSRVHRAGAGARRDRPRRAGLRGELGVHR